MTFIVHVFVKFPIALLKSFQDAMLKEQGDISLHLEIVAFQRNKYLESLM